VEACHFDLEVSGIDHDREGLGLSTKKMMKIETFHSAGWDLDTVWCLAEGRTYPLLRWQDTEAPVADAGDDIISLERAMILLDGTRSHDDLFVSEHEWVVQNNNGEVFLYGDRAAYTFEQFGNYTVELKVTDLLGKIGTDEMSVTVLDNTRPIAHAGSDMIVNEDTTVFLNGLGSYDNQGIDNYTWSFEEGSRQVLLWGPEPTYVFTEPGTYKVTLTVADREGSIDSSSIIVTVLDATGPVADAGSDVEIPEGHDVVLDGSGSYDNVGIVDYLWTFIDAGEEVVLHGSRVSYVFDDPGSYPICLQVTDAAGLSDLDILNIKVIDRTYPIADAGPDILIEEDRKVTFSGESSIDNFGIANYTWSIDDERGTVLFGMRPSYTFPDPGIFVITLTVKDLEGLSGTDTAIYTVLDITAPVADAGSDIIVNEDTFFQFDGRRSSDNGEIIRYLWSIDNGDSFIMIEGSLASYTFTDPGRYSITLMVTDLGGNFDTDSVKVTVKDMTPPIADLGPDVHLKVNTVLVLNTSRCSDNGWITDCVWSVSGQGIDEKMNGSEFRYRFERPGRYNVRLQVLDLDGNSDEDEMNIIVDDDIPWIVISIVSTLTIMGTIGIVSLILIRGKPRLFGHGTKE